ncbi:MAG: hypothetical protein J5976_03715 [Bacteroidales bacterium]|nr:hypothetical protein [Bacteroidales bacterium]
MTKINNQEESLGFLERVLKICDQYSVWKIIKALLILMMVSYVCYFAFNPEKIFELYDKYREKEHAELLKKRLDNTPQIQLHCERLLRDANADRVLFLELHNGTNSTGGLPFYYASASCEALAENIRPVADQYADVSLSLLPFSSYLFQHDYFSGDVEDLKNIDKSLMYRLMSNDVTHCAMAVVEGVDKPVGLLVLTYTTAVDHHCPETKKLMEHTALKLALLAEVKKN